MKTNKCRVEDYYTGNGFFYACESDVERKCKYYEEGRNWVREPRNSHWSCLFRESGLRVCQHPQAIADAELDRALEEL